MIHQGQARTPVRELILHCAAINTGQFNGMSAFQVFSIINQWHLQGGRKGGGYLPPFKHGFGYHGLIMPDGTFYKGRPFEMIGAHTKGHNTGSLGFLLIESKKITEIGEFRDYYTTRQRIVLKAMIEDLARSHGLERVSGHNDYAKKLCPGFLVYDHEWMPQ